MERVLDAVVSGTSRVLLICGEAGIGKSRLIAELEQMAATRGVVRVCGQCHREGSSDPLAPLLDLLRGQRQPGIQTDSRWAGNRDEQQLRKRELFERIDGALERLVVERARPLAGGTAAVLALEDVHWSDEATLDWILHAFRRSSRPLLLALTWRPDERGPKLGEVLGGLERTRVCTELRLGRLSRQDVSAMVAAIHGSEPRSAWVDALFRLTDGNPLFVEELLRTEPRLLEGVAASRAPLGELTIPQSLRASVEARVGELSPRARGLLELAAVLGRRFEFDRLCALDAGDGDAASFLGVVKELVAARLLVEESADALSFRHALTREIVLGGLLARERADMHRRIAEWIETDGGGHAAELSHHFSQARAWERTVIWARRAAREAVHAPGAAVEHFSRAIDAIDAQGAPPDAELLRQRGQAHDWLGEFDAARRDHEDALALAREAGDRDGTFRGLLQLGVLSRERDFVRAGALFRESLELARAVGSRPWVAESLGWLGFWSMMSGELRDARAHQEEALAIFESLGDRRGIAETLDHLGWTHYVSADLERSSRCYRRAAQLFEELGEPLGRASAMAGHATRGADYLQLTSPWPPDASPRSCFADAEESVRFAQRIAWRSGEARALLWFGLSLGCRGYFRRAMSSARRALRIARDDDQVRYHATARMLIGAILLDTLSPDEAIEELDHALDLSRRMGSPTVVSTTVSFLSRAHVERGELDRAEALLAGAGAATGSMPERLLAAARAELLLARGEPERALECAERLIETAIGRAGPIPSLWLLRGSALVALDRCEEAREVLLDGVAAAEERVQRPLLWRLLVQLGHAGRLVGRPGDAAASYERARKTIEALADELPDAERFRQAAGRRIPSVRRPPDAKALTPRERQVASLVGEGLTNQAIGRRLRISERTVEKHVENVLGKLQLTSRVQVAVWVVDARGRVE